MVKMTRQFCCSLSLSPHNLPPSPCLLHFPLPFSLVYFLLSISLYIILVLFLQEKQADVFWLLQVCLSTVEQGSESAGQLFTFTPSFYVEAIMDTYNALKGYFHPTVPYTELTGNDDDNVYELMES